jgi:hypothetical protein
MFRKRWCGSGWCLFVSSLLVGACGGETPGSETSAPVSETEEIATVRSAAEYWDPGCGVIPADVTVPLNGGTTSPNGSYNHPTQCIGNWFCAKCPGFIVDATASDPYWPFAAYAGPVPTRAEDCGKMWVRFSLWDPYGLREASNRVHGWVDFFSGQCMEPHAWIPISPPDPPLGPGGRYRLVAEAGYEGTYQRVRVAFY